MTETDSPQFTRLESQISRLIQSCEHLKAENRALRQKLSHSVNERTALIEKTQVIQTRIKKVIEKLKEQYHG